MNGRRAAIKKHRRHQIQVVMPVNNVRTPRHFRQPVTNENVASPDFFADIADDRTVGGDFVAAFGHGYREIADKKLCTGAFSKRIVGEKDAQSFKLPNCVNPRKPIFYLHTQFHQKNFASDLTRRSFLRRTALAAGFFMVPGALAEELMRQTPWVTQGPLYPEKLPLDTDNDLIIVNNSLTPAVGEITH